MKAECTRCDTVFDAETIVWARNTRTGEEAHGGNSKTHQWYGVAGKTWPAQETQEYEVQVGGVGTFGLCPECCDKHHRARERAAEYDSPCPPAWFDESYAGERWDDDY
ncbi:MAG: hypothetical protein NXI32_04910 [bacterium]|nr:hypothetical protein [bacterium]